MLKSIIRYAFNKIGYNIERLAAKKAGSFLNCVGNP